MYTISKNSVCLRKTNRLMYGFKHKIAFGLNNVYNLITIRLE